MKCDEAQPQLIEGLYGELSPEEQARLREHLAVCDACRREMEGLEQTRQRLARLPKPEPRLDPGRVYRAASVRSERGRRRWRRAAIAASAAAVLIMALAGARLRFQWDADRLTVSWGPERPTPQAARPKPAQPSPLPWSQYEERIETLEDVASLLAEELRASDARQAAAAADFERRLARWQRSIEEDARQSDLRWRLAEQDIRDLYLTQFSPDSGAKGAIR